jgi:hypothetical protein
MEFNQFQKELRHLDIPKNQAYFLTLIYEQVREQAKQLSDCASLIVALSQTVANFVDLNEAMERKLQQIARGSRTEGVDVSTESVLDKPKSN